MHFRHTVYYIMYTQYSPKYFAGALFAHNLPRAKLLTNGVYWDFITEKEINNPLKLPGLTCNSAGLLSNYRTLRADHTRVHY